MKPAKRKPPEPSDRFYRYARIIVLLIPLVVFLPALRLGYVYFDDDILVLENQSKIADPSNLGLFFTTDVFLGKAVPYYRPMLNVALMIGAALGGDSPAGYHFLSILLHCLTTLGVFLLLRQLGFSRGKQMAGALIFSVHPLLANAVFWIPALNDLLISFFGVYAGYTLLRWLEKKTTGRIIIHLLCVAGAFFSKESAIALPVIFLLIFVLKKQKLTDLSKIALYSGWLAIAIVWFFLRKSSIGVLEGDTEGLDAIVANIRFIPEILARFFLPWDLAIMPVFSVMFTVAGVIILLGGILLVFSAGRKTWQMILLGAAWFMAFALPNMFLRQFNTPDSFDYIEHRAYMPAIGLFILMLALVPETWTDLMKRVPRMVLIAVILAFSGLSLWQSEKYRNGPAFWESVLKVSPNRAWFHHFYGRYWFKQQDFGQFEVQIKEALRLREYGTFLYNMGMIELMRKKNHEGAYRYFTRAIEKGETKPEVIRNFVGLCIESAGILDKAGKHDSAMGRLETALRFSPDNIQALMNLALYRAQSGNERQAVALWKKAISVDPTVLSAYRNLSLYYGKDPRTADSSSYYNTLYIRNGGKP